MERITMTLKEKFESLTPEQRENLVDVKTEQELDALLAEAGIEPTAETRAAFLSTASGPRELTAEEIGDVTGGCSNGEKRRVSSPSGKCAHGFDACCDHIGVTRGGVVSYEKCGFLSLDGGEWVCNYGGK